MVVADRNNSELSTMSNSATVNNQSASNKSRRTRQLNTSTSTNQVNNNHSSPSQDDIDSSNSSDSEQSVRVGDDYQAEINNFWLPKPAPKDYMEKAVLIWTPNNEIDDDELNDYINLAKDKYKYNEEQALGILFWHEFNLQCALADLPNYCPYPDDWTNEEKALFDQAYQFHNKNFHKIQQMLPEKKLASIIKFYYTQKKCKTRLSHLDKQVKKASISSQQKEDTNDSMDYENNNEIENTNNHINNCKDQLIQEKCQQCSIKTTGSYYNTKSGLLCKNCFIKLKNNKNEDQQITKEEEVSSIKSSISLDYLAIKEIVKEHFTNSSCKVLEGYDNEINESNITIRRFEQEIEKKKSLLKNTLPDLSLLNQNNSNRIISRWTNEETLLMSQAIRDYGKDYKIIADIIGTKSTNQIKNYFVQNWDKMKLSDLVEELDAEENGDDANDTNDEIVNDRIDQPLTENEMNS